MGVALFKLTRKTYRGLTTIGELEYPNGDSCYTLEDVVRAWGIKDGGNTAIPAGRYYMCVSMSQKFKREMVMVYTEANQYELKAGGIEFKGIRIHGGNTHLSSWGCIIVGKNKLSDEKISGSCEKEITDLVKEYIQNNHECILEVRNLAQSQ
jgi:hypothetical protein